MTEDWKTRAECRGLPVLQVLPVLCFNECSVRKECLNHALTSGDWHRDVTYDPHLVWGGYHPGERHKVMKETGFRAAKAFELLIERENHGAPNKLCSGNAQSIHPGDRHS